MDKILRICTWLLNIYRIEAHTTLTKEKDLRTHTRHEQLPIGNLVLFTQHLVCVDSTAARVVVAVALGRSGNPASKAANIESVLVTKGGSRPNYASRIVLTWQCHWSSSEWQYRSGAGQLRR